MPYGISKTGYGGNDNLSSLVGDLSQFKTANPYGLQEVGTEGSGNVNIGGGQYNVRYDPTTDKYMVSDLSDPHLGAYVYGNDGKLQNWTPYNSGNDWGNFGMFLASALTMGAAGMAGAAGGAAADTGAVGGAGLAGDATAAGYGGLDAAGAGSLGGGASIAGGSSLGELGAGAAAAGGTGAMGAGGAAGGMTGDATAAGYGGMDAASAGTMGGGSGVAGGSTMGNAVASAGGGNGWLSQMGGKIGAMDSGDLAGAAVKYGAPIVGGLISANGAKSAAESQKAATDAANAMLQGQYNTTRNDLAPWRDSGVKANNALVSAMGLGANDGSTGFGSLSKSFTPGDLTNEPGYQFGLQQGQRAIDNRASAGGSYFSGNALKAAARYGNDYAGTKYQDAFNRDLSTKNQQYGFLSGMSTQGQNAANMTGQFGSATTGAMAGNVTALGNAQGASQIAQGNALSNALGSVSNNYNQNNMLQDILASQQRQRAITGGNSSGF